MSGKNFDHRKLWVVERLRVLSSVFAIDVCAYAAMSNHLHVVLHVERAEGFGSEEIDAREPVGPAQRGGAEPSHLGQRPVRHGYTRIDDHVWMRDEVGIRHLGWSFLGKFGVDHLVKPPLWAEAGHAPD
ncbi:MAG: hypothetical protein OXU20_18910, partial [Myxococcales bacterium]|nr:hypothetical protein [Myxococcales bacterium]